MKSNISKLAFLSVVVLLPSYLLSYNFFANKSVWTNKQTTMYISTTSYPQGTWMDYALQRAMYRWSRVKGSNFTFYINRDTDGRHYKLNGKNEIYTGNTSEFTSIEKTLAYTTVDHRNGVIYEKDLAFNPYVTWISFLGDWCKASVAQPDNEAYFEGVVLHELGYVLGLCHEDDVLATMNSKYPNFGPVASNNIWEVHGDDRNGIRNLYPDSTHETDIVVSKYFRTGLGTSDVASALYPSPTYLWRGDTYSIPYTTENLSTTIQSYSVSFYLSTDSMIRPYDIYLTTTRVNNIGKGTAVTKTATITIPTNISAGTYYLGYIIDPSDEISESSNNNNYIILHNPRYIK